MASKRRAKIVEIYVVIQQHQLLLANLEDFLTQARALIPAEKQIAGEFFYDFWLVERKVRQQMKDSSVSLMSTCIPETLSVGSVDVAKAPVESGQRENRSEHAREHGAAHYGSVDLSTSLEDCMPTDITSFVDGVASELDFGPDTAELRDMLLSLDETDISVNEQA